MAVNYLPPFLLNEPIIKAIHDIALEKGAEGRFLVDDVEAQRFINTATWGLSDWEEMLGITVNESKPIEERREYIKSKIRGRGTATVILVKSVVESYSNGEVEVTEKNDVYTVHIKFIGERGLPKNLEDVQKSLREVLPAHLDIEFEFTYLTWRELDKNNVLWSEVDSLTWEELETLIF